MNADISSGQTSAEKPEAVGKERAQLAALTRPQRRWLSTFSCAWCDMPAHRPGCGAIYNSGRCTEETRSQKRAQALKTYAPRKRAPAASGISPEARSSDSKEQPEGL